MMAIELAAGSSRTKTAALAAAAPQL
jgi:hypothetical protein